MVLQLGVQLQTIIHCIAISPGYHHGLVGECTYALSTIVRSHNLHGHCPYDGCVYNHRYDEEVFDQ